MKKLNKMKPLFHLFFKIILRETGNHPITALSTILMTCFVGVSCQQGPAYQNYLFLGHPYDWHRPNRVDPRLEQLDYSKYDEIWLGGDVCSRTAEDPATMDYLDSLFDLTRVKWALGNHDLDYGPPQNVLEKLPHAPFFTEWKDGYCLSVLNTHYFWPYPNIPPQRQCAEKQAQWEMVKSVADTIEKASHWVILHHHAMFTDLKIAENGDTLRPFNLNPIPFYATCDSLSNITDLWYPQLLNAQKRGVQLVLIGGDVGMQTKHSAYQTDDGIWLLGSGINNSVPRDYAPDYVKDFGPDKVLELSYNKRNGLFEWKFIELNKLLDK
jgi:hypothetical protein